jgi:hypothetical protein
MRHPVRHSTNIYGSTVFLLTKIKPEYSDTLYNTTNFPGPLMRRIRQVPHRIINHTKQIGLVIGIF